jgi:gluconolactonase
MEDRVACRAEGSLLAIALAVWVAGPCASCGGNESGGGGGTGGGGSPGTGGVTGSGGATDSGGATGSGGTTVTGGATGSGGTTGMGGAEPAGGVTSTGGATVTGGVTATGGTTVTGGKGSGGVTTSTGGVTTGTGGVTTGTGGSITRTGGAQGSGGGTGTGGGSGATRVGGACQAGASYAAPVLSGTPKLIVKDTGSSASNGTYEGPVWLAASSVLLFSDVNFTNPDNPGQMLKLTPPSTIATYVADSGTNGMAVDGSGVVYACSHKVQGIVKLDYAGAALTTLVSTYGGKHFNSPNDLVIRSDGTIYFTDPDYQLGNRTSETGKKGIYRVTPSGTVTVVDDTFNEPNGITLSPDETILYVADYAGNAVRTFAVAADGSTSGRKDFVSVRSPDGFGMDCLGNLYVASGSPGTIEVYSPSAAKLGSVTVAASTSNLAFGGTDGKTLYVTSGKALYSLDMNLPGFYY